MVLVGASFRTAGIEARERIARRLAEVPPPGSRIGKGEVFERAVLETCNRVEVYLACSDPGEVSRLVLDRLGEGGLPPSSFYVMSGIGALRHIFRVAGGLDSPVLGEEQILDQVKEAGKVGRARGESKSILSSLFDAACSSGRRIRDSYTVSPRNSSVSAFALKHALKELGRRPSGVLLIGTGQTAKLAALSLKGSKVYLLSARRGSEARFPGAVRIPRKRVREVLSRCDLVIAATRRPGYVLRKRDFPRNRRTVVLDLGFPRNVDPSIGDSHVRLYDLDDVASWALSKGSQGDLAAEGLVEAEAHRFDSWLTASRLTPTLANIYRWAERIRDEETVAALRKLPGLSTHDRTVIEALSRRLTGKLISPHAAFVKEVGSEDDQSERLHLLKSIFKDGGR